MKPEKLSYGEKMFGSKMRIMLVILFLAIIGLFSYTAFYNSNIPTKGIIGTSDDNEGIFINSELNVPDFNLKQEIGRVEIHSISSRGELIVGDESFSLRDMSQNYIVLEDFKGNLFFNNNKVLVLKGKAKNTLLNGFNISSDTGRRKEVELTRELSYSSLNLKNIFLSNLNYLSSGKITFGMERSVLNILNQVINLNNFNGDIKIYNNEMNMEGVINSIEVSGKENILIK